MHVGKKTREKIGKITEKLQKGGVCYARRRGGISGNCQIRKRRCPTLTTKLHLISHSFSTCITLEKILFHMWCI